jgi:hypothetical protein
MPVEVYVWFEADPNHAPLVQAAFVRLWEEMGRGDSAIGSEPPRLLRRPDVSLRDGLPRTTWMEVWPCVPQHSLAGWLGRLEAAAVSSGAAALGHGDRHVEVFVPMRASGPVTAAAAAP